MKESRTRRIKCWVGPRVGLHVLEDKETHDPAGSQIMIPQFALAKAYSLHGHLHIRHYCLNLQERLVT